MRSGDARLMRMASKSDVSWPLSWRLGLILSYPLLAQGQRPRPKQPSCPKSLGPWPWAFGLSLLAGHRQCRCGFGFRGRHLGWRPRLRPHQLDVQAERLELADEDVERLGQSGLERSVALDDRFVDLRPSRHVVRLGGEQLLEDVRRAVGLERPDLHLAEALAAELRLAAERLLRDERVRSDGARVDLVVDQVRQLQHVDVADGDVLFER